MARTITNFNPRDFKTPVLYQLCQQIHSLLDAGLPADDATSRSILQAIGRTVTDVGNRLAVDRKSEFTALKDESDQRRDVLFLDIVGEIDRASRRFYKPGDMASGKRLAAALEKRQSSLQTLADDFNTTELDLLFRDFDTPEAATDLASLGLTEAYNLLKNENTAFKAFVEQEAVAASEENPPPPLDESKPVLGKKVRTMLGVLDHFVDENQPPYVALMEQLYDRITSETAAAKAAETRAEGESESPPPQA